jgi:hypothetical protein
MVGLSADLNEFPFLTADDAPNVTVEIGVPVFGNPGEAIFCTEGDVIT